MRVRPFLATLTLLAACSDRGSDLSQIGDQSVGTPDAGSIDAALATCDDVSQCPGNPAASCAQVCSDGTNPCVSACVDHRCVARGCPAADAGAAATHHEGESCDDGSGCDPGLVCKAVGDPCPTYPKCRVCYLPCGDGGVCPTGYNLCLPSYGQGGDVCIR